MRKYKIAVARLPGGGSERMEAVAWLIRTVRKMDQDPRVGDLVSICFADTPAPMVRNRIVVEARKAKADYILSIDDDMAPDYPRPGSRSFWDVSWDFLMHRRNAEIRHWEEIVDREGKITPGDPRFYYKTHEDPGTPIALREFPPATIAAPYCGPPPGELPYIFRWTCTESNCPNPNFKLEMMGRDECAVRAGVEEVAALPTGLIIWDIRVFDILPPPWFDYEYEDRPYETKKASTEDVYQTRNASMLGLPQYTAWDSWAGHVKVKIVPPPVVLTRDQVHQSLVDAVHRDWTQRDRLVIQGEHKPKPAGLPALIAARAARAATEAEARSAPVPID